jgi:hypothetical protein
VAIGLYDEDGHLEQCKVYRGNAMDDYTNDYFDIPNLGNYKLGFFAGSYDRTGGTVLGATLKVKAFQMTVPIWHTGKHHMGSPAGVGSSASACPHLPSVSWNDPKCDPCPFLPTVRSTDPLCVPRLAMAAADGFGAAAEGSAPLPPVATEGEDCAAFTPLGGGVDPALEGTWSVAPCSGLDTSRDPAAAIGYICLSPAPPPAPDTSWCNAHYMDTLKVGKPPPPGFEESCCCDGIGGCLADLSNHSATEAEAECSVGSPP